MVPDELTVLLGAGIACDCDSVDNDTTNCVRSCASAARPAACRDPVRRSLDNHRLRTFCFSALY